MQLSDFDYDLPTDLIALQPVLPKDTAKMLVLNEASIKDCAISDLPDFLTAKDLLVFNDTKVIPAKLTLYKLGLTGAIHVNLHKNIKDSVWSVFAKPGKKIKIGDILYQASSPRSTLSSPRSTLSSPRSTLSSPRRRGSSLNNNLSTNLDSRLRGNDSRHENDCSIEVLDKLPDGQIILDFKLNKREFEHFINQHGTTPLPPYIEKKHTATEADKTLYQTMFAIHSGSVAAPTAGLHFTPNLMARLSAKGVRHCFVTLHVGGGTFLPVKTENLRDHKMHSEYCELSSETADLINQTKKNGGRIIAIGTTSTRTLEACADQDGEVRAFCGDINLFIIPGYQFKLVDLMVTNFHLPKSTLLMLIAAFAGYDEVFTAYAHARKSGYRFYSYGDCCLLYGKNHV